MELESPSPADCFDRACILLEQGRAADALEWFRIAHRREPGNARFRSYFGLCVGTVERKFDQSIELCRSAAKQEFFNPDQYLNLARLHVAFGFKAEGVRYLRRGHMIDPGHSEISALMQQLGLRGRPVLAFLPRRHAINRWLGAARHVLARERSIAA